MNIFKTILIGLTVCALPFAADAVVAKRGFRTVTQPDGSQLKIRVIGDEYLHFTTDEEGHLLCKDAAGFYTYAEIDTDGSFRSTGKRLNDPSYKASALKLSDVDIERLSEKRNVATRRMQSYTVPAQRALLKSPAKAPQTGKGLSYSTYQHFGSPKGLIILVEFSDKKFTLSNPAAYFNDMINGSDFTQYGGTGSALKYFTDQSAGQFTPDFDVLGPVTLPNKCSYYGGNDRYGDDMHPAEMVTDAIKILDSSIDFKQYDTDGDGYIDNVFVFYAGQGEASGGDDDTVWPHSWDIESAGLRLTVDGVKVGHYACSNEWEGNRPDGVGTFIHEFSHVLGLPDLYHTTENVYYTPCDYSVLDYGPYNNEGRTPPNYGAYELNAMGWFEPIMMDRPMQVKLNPIISGEFGLIPTSSDNEFFLFENRQQEGWDKYIPGHGMLIWHIDYKAAVFDNNVVNNTKSHQYVDIEEANNNPDGSKTSTMKGWPFPGTSGNTSFTATTTPALKTWSGQGIDLPVTDIKETGGVISFNVAGGASSALATPEPTAKLADDGSRAFIASWPAVEGATDYILTAYSGEGVESGEITTGFDGSTPGSGWEASKTGYYTTSSNYGQSSPSFKFDTTGQTLTSPVAEGMITKIEFWNKGQGTTGTFLVIEGYSDGKWIKLAEYTPTSNNAVTTVIENLPEGLTQVRFTMNKTSGNIAIDDIVISYSGSSEILPGYNAISTKGLTSFRIDNLIDGIVTYHFTVQATNGSDFSAVSNHVYIDVPAVTGITDQIFDDKAEVEYFNLQGMPVRNPTPGQILIRRQGTSVSKVIVR